MRRRVRKTSNDLPLPFELFMIFCGHNERSQAFWQDNDFPKSVGVSSSRGHGEFSFLSSFQSSDWGRVDVGQIYWCFGRQNSGIFHHQSSTTSRLYRKFRDETRWCFRGWLPQVRCVRKIKTCGVYDIISCKAWSWTGLNWMRLNNQRINQVIHNICKSQWNDTLCWWLLL